MIVDADTENRTDGDQILFDGTLRLGRGAKIMAGTEFEPPVYVADGARILRDVVIGRYSYVGRNSILTRARIGTFCSIGHDCQINNFRAHPTDWLSTHPFQFDSQIFGFWPEYSRFEKRPFDGDASQKTVHIDHDVWIGAAVFITGGVTIGFSAILGTRALVTKDIPAFAVAYGSPATVRRYRVPPERQREIIASNWWLHPGPNA